MIVSQYAYQMAFITLTVHSSKCNASVGCLSVCPLYNVIMAHVGRAVFVGGSEVLNPLHTTADPPDTVKEMVWGVHLTPLIVCDCVTFHEWYCFDY